MRRTKAVTGRALAILLALALSVTALAAAIWLPATSPEVMLRLMARYALPEDTLLPETEYPAMAGMICAYLRGERDEFQLVYRAGGAEYLAFNAREQQHMADVQGLFALCRTVLWTGAALSAMLAAAAMLLRVSGFRRTFRWALLGVLAALTIVAVIAAVDFDSLFILFHEVAFVNELWLLDPRTDMLIRLMPIGFFVAYAGVIGCGWLGALLLMLGATFLPARKKNEGVENP